MRKTAPKRTDIVEMIGMDGHVHSYPRWLLMILVTQSRRRRRCRAAALIGRDRLSGMIRILPAAAIALEPLLDSPYSPPSRRISALNPSRETGRRGAHTLRSLLDHGLDELLMRRQAERDAENFDNTPMPGRAHSQLLADAALREAKKRQCA